MPGVKHGGSEKGSTGRESGSPHPVVIQMAAGIHGASNDECHGPGIHSWFSPMGDVLDWTGRNFTVITR